MRARRSERSRNCLPVFRFVCPRRWEGLTPTDEPTVRHCGQCDRQVYFCSTDAETIAHARVGNCIAREMPDAAELPRVYVGQPVGLPPVTPQQEEARRFMLRERGVDDAIKNARRSSRYCPRCGYPAQTGGSGAECAAARWGGLSTRRPVLRTRYLGGRNNKGDGCQREQSPGWVWRIQVAGRIFMEFLVLVMPFVIARIPLFHPRIMLNGVAWRGRDATTTAFGSIASVSMARPCGRRVSAQQVHWKGGAPDGRRAGLLTSGDGRRRINS